MPVAGYCDCNFEGPFSVVGRKYNKKMTYANLYAIFLQFYQLLREIKNIFGIFAAIRNNSVFLQLTLCGLDI